MEDTRLCLMWNGDSLSANAVPRSNVEWLQHVSRIIGVLLITEEALGSELKGVYEVLVVVVQGPVVDGNDSLLRQSVSFSWELRVHR